MRITLDVDESLVREVLQLTNLSTPEDAIDLALQELVRSRRKKSLLELAGQVQLAPEFDHKALRDTPHAAR